MLLVKYLIGSLFKFTCALHVGTCRRDFCLDAFFFGVSIGLLVVLLGAFPLDNAEHLRFEGLLVLAQAILLPRIVV